MGNASEEKDKSNIKEGERGGRRDNLVSERGGQVSEVKMDRNICRSNKQFM